MAINLKNREAEQLLKALSRKTRLGKTRIVLELLRVESARQARIADVDGRKRRIKALIKRASRRAHNRHLTPDQLIGYGKTGAPK